MARLDVAVASCNAPPIAAVAGPTRVAKASRVALNAGPTTDPNGDALEYRWTLTRLPEGSTATLSDADAVSTTFTADKAGAYRVTLVASDSELESAEKAFNVLSENTPPTAVAGPDVRIGVGELVRLDASGSSDENGDPLTIRWEVAAAPNGSLAVVDADSRFAPDVRGQYQIRLTVNDGEAESSDTMLVSMGVSDNRPVANAGTGLRVERNTMVMLDGSLSRDADGDTLTYAWSSIRSPGGAVFDLNASSTARPTFIPPEYGVYVFELTVGDGYYTSQPSRVEVQVVPILSNSGMFDPARVYVLGTIQEGTAYRNTICDVTAETSISGGFPGTPANLSIRPRDGAMIYIDTTESMRRVRVFAPDEVLYDLGVGGWSYPQDPAANDPLVAIPHCPTSVARILIDPATSDIVYACESDRSIWYRESGEVLPTCITVDSASVLALHPDGSMLCSATVMDPAGGVRRVRQRTLLSYQTWAVRAASGGGFWAAETAGNSYTRHLIGVDGEMSPMFAYDTMGINLATSFAPYAAFDATGAFWVSGDNPLSVFRWEMEVPTVMFTESAQDVCRFDVTIMISGP